jgi:hypothetical protein
MSAVLFSYIVESANIGVVQAGNRSRLTLEAFSPFGIVG